MTTIDPQLYRVNLICACQNDIAFGYGPDEAAARAVAEGIFREEHGSKALYTQIVIEKAGQTDPFYRTEQVLVRLEFTDGLGSWLDARARGNAALGSMGFGAWWAAESKYRGAHPLPYVFETGYRAHAQSVFMMLREIANERGNVKLRKAASEKAEVLAKLIAVMP